MEKENKNLEFKPKNCWEVFSSPEHVRAMDKMAGNYVSFLSECKTERETVDWILKRIAKEGFSSDIAKPEYYRAFRGKTLLIARKGRKPLSEGFRLLGAHADTPRLDLKQRPLYEDCSVGLAKTHYYGGIRKHQWLARPLALHGVVVKTDGTVVKIVYGEDASEPCLTIADLLPHLAKKQVEQKLSEAFDAEKLNLLIGHSPLIEENKIKAKSKKSDEEPKNDKPAGRIKKKVLEILNAKYGIVEEDLYSAELQAVPAGPARFIGFDSALIGGYGQDDRVCVYSALEAFLAEKKPEHTQIVIFWDKEEVGSEGSTGAKSLFLEYSLEDLIRAWDKKARLSQVFDKSWAVSADVHGALDPDYQDLHEKLNAAMMGYGPCFCKFTGHGGKYLANDAHAEYVGKLRALLNKAGIPWQMAELGKVDVGGGGTVAKYLAAYGMDIIDFGPPVLSMHSPFEVVSKVDLYATMLAYKAFLGS